MLHRALFLFVLCQSWAWSQTTSISPLPTEEQSSPNDSSVAADAPADLQTKRAEVAEELRVARRRLDSAATDQNDEKSDFPSEALSRDVELLKQIEVIVAQQQTATAKTTERETLKNDLAEQLRKVRESRPLEEKPFSFLFLDRLRDEYTTQLDRQQAVASGVATAQESLAQAKEKLDAAERSFRQAKESLETNNDAAKSTELAAEQKYTELKLRVASEQRTLRRQELTNESLNKEINESRIKLLAEKIGWIEHAARFSEDELQDKFVDLRKQEDQLNRQLQTAQSNQSYVEQRWFSARTRLESSDTDGRILAEEVEARRLDFQAAQLLNTSLSARLERLTVMREVWNRRFNVVNRLVDAAELNAFKEEAHANLAQIEREIRSHNFRIDELRQNIASLESKLSAANGQADSIRRWVSEQQNSLRRMIETTNLSVASMQASQRLHTKLLAEIAGDVETWSIRDWLASASHRVERIWKMELALVDDRPITVGKIVIGVVLLLSGFALARFFTGTLGRFLTKRFRMHESGIAALQSLCFYFLLIAFSWSALRFANVPLTMFTFLGGAIAIGIGFGSQNIVNNFISGLIILAERPIKVGDLIQVEAVYGSVTHIGARSTQIRTGDNQDIIVPNSKFLENNVVNLTLGDDKLRTFVSVGIAYGSNTRDAAKLMKYAAEEHGLVLKKPEPFVWFAEFGDNSLNFELHFWVKVRKISERLRTESDLRYRIDQLFRDAGITIAFPQQDIHIDSLRPIDVHVISSAARDGNSLSRESTSKAA